MNSKKHIEACLQEFLNKEEISIHTIDFLSDLGEGSNYTGVVGRLKISGTQNGKEIIYKFIIKTTEKNEGFRTFMSVRYLYTHEIFIYQTVFPYFKRIQEENKIIERISIPTLIGYSTEEFNETIILEDMALKEFKPISVKKTFDYKHAKLVFEELGRFHALSFALQKYYPTVFEECIKNLFDLEFHGEFGKTTEHFFNQCFCESVELFDSNKEKDTFSKIIKLQNVLFKNVQSINAPGSAKPYQVIGHGDLWVSNAMFKYNETSEPIATCFVDYQLSKVYSPACDISQIMFACLDEHVRNKYYNDLIEKYYKSFSSLLKEVGCEPDTLFPYHILREHLKKFSIHGIATALRMVYIVSILPEETPKIHLAENRFVAVQMTRQSRKDPVLFKNRMKNILLDFIKYGYDF